MLWCKVLVCSVDQKHREVSIKYCDPGVCFYLYTCYKHMSGLSKV